MKKLLILMLILVLLLTGCGGDGQTDGPAVDDNVDTPPMQDACEALGHDMAAATCENPAVCTVCGLTEGEALGHDMAEANCVTPSACTRCGLTEGEALGHSWTDATYQAPKTCTVCGATEGEKLSRPAYTTDQIEAAGAYEDLLSLTDHLVGQSKDLTYDEQTNLLQLTLVPNSGAAEAYSQRGDNWGLYTAYLKVAATYCQWNFREEGYDIDVRATVLDDRDTSKTLYDVMDQQEMTNVYADLVPEVLKTAGFAQIYNTVMVNYLMLPKNAAYDEESQTLVIYIMAMGSSGDVIRMFMEQGTLQEYPFWNSLTDAMVRWCKEGKDALAKDGYDIRVALILLDGNLNGDPLYAVRDGEVIYSIG